MKKLMAVSYVLKIEIPHTIILTHDEDGDWWTNEFAEMIDEGMADLLPLEIRQYVKEHATEIGVTVMSAKAVKDGH